MRLMRFDALHVNTYKIKKYKIFSINEILIDSHCKILIANIPFIV